MKLTRKLIPAFVMLLVSAVLMSTASFAWFAMNTTVEATGMEVKAKADSIFLEISGKKDVADDKPVWKTVGTDEAVDGEGNVIKPVTLYPAGHEITSADKIEDKASWFYRYVNTPGHATDGAGDKQTIGNLNDYVYHTTFKVRLNENMVQSAANLRVSSITLPADTGITAIIRCGNNFKEFKLSDDEVAQDAGLLLATMGKDPVDIDVYIYIDGTNANVYTNNATKLTGAVSFTLSVSASAKS